MDGLPELLALLYGAGERWTTVAATGVRWHDRVVGDRARERFNARSSSRSVSQMVSFTSGEKPARFSESSERMWIARPGRWRRETDRHVSVGDGALWWTWSDAMGFVTNEEAPEVGHGSPLDGWAHHLDPGSLLSGLCFESIDAQVENLEVWATPSERPRLDNVLHAPGADRIRLVVDRERGIVLRSEAFLDGEPFSRSELRDAVFDEALDDRLFVLEPPPGEPRQSPRGASEELTLAEASARASFAVFAPAELPDGPWELHVRYHAAHRAIAETVALIFFRRDGRESVTLQQVAADREERLGRSIEHELRVRRGGTAILIRSAELDDAALERLAGTLETV